MSATITLLKEKTVQLSEFQLHEPLGKRVEHLVQKMGEEVNNLPHEKRQEILEEIKIWEAQFSEDYGLNPKADRKAAAHALLFLAVTFIEYTVIPCAKGDIEQAKWALFSDEIHKIVVDILPKEINRDQFFKEDKEKQLEIMTRYLIAELLDEIMPEIQQMFLNLEEEFYKEADRMNLDFAKRFETIKQKLSDLNQNRAVAIHEFHAAFDLLTQNMTRISEDLGKKIQQGSDFAEKVSAARADVFHLLNECESVLDNIKV